MISFVTGAAARRNAGIIGLLSVELLLLSFFILATSASPLEDGRARSVMESVNAAFRSLGPAAFGVPGSDADVPLEDEVAQLAAAIPLARFATSAEGADRLYLDLPVAGFFHGDDSRLKPHMVGFFDHLLSLLADASGAREYEVAFLQGGQSPSALQLARATELARSWITGGGRIRQVSTGFFPGDPSWMRIVIGWSDKHNAGG